MNICFYTSDQPTVASQLNISHLVHNRPAHNYSFLNVVSQPRPRLGFMAWLKKAYGEWRFDDGRFDFHRDLVAIDKRLKDYVRPLNKAKFINGFADAVNDEKSVRFLREVQPDVIIQAGAGILKENIFSLAAQATINLHHGLAPEIRGIESTFWCMYYGIREKIGVTCHIIDATLDTGTVIKQQALGSRSRTYTDVQSENILMGREVLVAGVDMLEQGNCHIHSLGEVPSYYFGWPGATLYSELKKNNFDPLKQIGDKPFKMKEKNIFAV